MRQWKIKLAAGYKNYCGVRSWPCSLQYAGTFTPGKTEYFFLDGRWRYTHLKIDFFSQRGNKSAGFFVWKCKCSDWWWRKINYELPNRNLPQKKFKRIKQDCDYKYSKYISLKLRNPRLHLKNIFLSGYNSRTYAGARVRFPLAALLYGRVNVTIAPGLPKPCDANNR